MLTCCVQWLTAELLNKDSSASIYVKNISIGKMFKSWNVQILQQFMVVNY